jgi:WD40 repeat protein
MKTWQGTLSGTACIVAIVVAGVWYANDPQMPQFPQSRFTSGRATSSPLPEFSVNQIAWLTDGRSLLSLSRGGLNAEPQLALHDIHQKTTRTPINAMGDWIHSAAPAVDGQHVLVGSNHGRLWWIASDSAEMPVALVELPVPRSFFSVTAVASDGRQACGGTNTGLICVCDLARQTSVTLSASQKSSVLDLRFSNDNQRLVSAQGNGHISLWELSSGELSHEFAVCAGPCRGAAFLPDGQRLITAGLDDTVRIWDIAGGRELWRGEFGLFGVMALDVSADGASAAWGGCNHKIVVWDLQRGQKKFDIATPASVVFHLRFSPDGILLAAAGSDGTIRLYDALTGAEHGVIAMDASYRS